MLETIFRRVEWILIFLSVALAGCASGPPQRDLQSSVRAAEATLAKFQNDPEMASLRANMKDAKAILIVSPHVARGVALSRNAETQEWSAPAFYQVARIEAAGGRLGGGGFSVGAQNLELVALAMTDKALEWFLSPHLPGTSDMNVVAGGSAAASSGSGTSGAPDMMVFMSPKLADAKGIGTLRNIVVSIDKAGNQSYYGSPVTPAEILVKRSVSNPDAEPLQKAVAALD
jgi:lipid-binding SYLF domain-containing protein